MQVMENLRSWIAKAEIQIEDEKVDGGRLGRPQGEVCRKPSDEAFIDWILLTWAKNPERATGQCSKAKVPAGAPACQRFSG